MLKIFNTLTREKEVFKPIHEGKVGMYVCGVTVYDLCHIGHGRTFVCFDVIARYLRSLGYDLTYVRNITDVDDKIIKRALENKETCDQLVDRMVQEMYKDFDALNVLRPDFEPRATHHIPEIIEIVEKLIARGHAYVADNGDVMFDVESFKEYGKLSRQDLDQLQAGARIEINEIKKNPMDFVLWKMSKENEPSWPSPWGAGRPGWHIECSAMNCKQLGEHFDIHGGGSDLMFPHHENEIAQSCCAHGGQYVNYWIHSGMIMVDKEKMSKSLGNFFKQAQPQEKGEKQTRRHPVELPTMPLLRQNEKIKKIRNHPVQKSNHQFHNKDGKRLEHSPHPPVYVPRLQQSRNNSFYDLNPREESEKRQDAPQVIVMVKPHNR
mgnify:CR=1 FL=1